MRPLISAFGANTKYKVDFLLVPIAIIFIEIAVFITQFTTDFYGQLNKIVLLRILHTLMMLLVASFVSRNFKRLNKAEVNFRTIATTGVLVLAVGDLTHGLLASIIGIDLISSYRRFGIVLIEGCIWFPVFMIVVGNRREIIRGFKEYEHRLIIAARTRSRASSEFIVKQKLLQEKIRRDLLGLLRNLKHSIVNTALSSEDLSQRFAAIQPSLLGKELRDFSRGLEALEPKRKKRFTFISKAKRVNIWLQQFRILYRTSIRVTPLRQAPYILVLISLVIPTYLYFYSLAEFLIIFPLLLIFTYIFTRLTVRIQLGNSYLVPMLLPILIYITGALPFAINFLAPIFLGDAKPQFPNLISAIFLPIAYLMFMVALQVLRPRALSIIQSDELLAGHALQSEIEKIVSKEFTQNLSHQWAVFIHGKILTRLAATSLKLESISQAGDTKLFNETVQSLILLLDDADLDFEEISIDLQSQVTSRLNPWAGLLEINLHIDPSLFSIRSPRVRDLGEVIEELISNSIRHGKSKKIDLSILPLENSDLEIIAIDDAALPSIMNGDNSGLGTRIFNLASDGRWSLAREGSSTVFRLVMTIRN